MERRKDGASDGSVAASLQLSVRTSPPTCPLRHEGNVYPDRPLLGLALADHIAKDDYTV